VLAINSYHLEISHRQVGFKEVTDVPIVRADIDVASSVRIAQALINNDVPGSRPSCIWKIAQYVLEANSFKSGAQVFGERNGRGEITIACNEP